MTKDNCKRFLSVLLTICMLFSMFGASTVYAVDINGCTCAAEDDNHTEDCTLFVENEAVCTCTPVEGIHQEGCNLYTAPAIENEPETVYEDGCTCTPIDGIHQENCSLYAVTADDTENEISFSTGIYLDADRTQLVSALTPNGAVLNDWTYLKDSNSVEDRYLGISLNGLSMDSDKQYQLVVEMAPILYINQNSDPVLSNTTVSFTRNSPITVNTTGQYEPATYSLSNLTYLIDSGSEGLTFGLPLRFDINLWNKLDGALLGNGTDPLLEVYLQEKQEDGSFVTIEGKCVSLLQASVSGGLGYSVGFRTYVVGGSNTETKNMGADDTMRAHFGQFTNSYNGGHYISDLTIKLTMPSCTVGGTTYRLHHKDFTINCISGKAEYQESFDEETGILTITAQNVYTKSSLFDIYFTVPDALKSTPGSYKFVGYLSVISDDIQVTTNLPKEIIVDTDSKAILNTFAYKGMANVLDRETVQVFGNLAINNTAAAQNGSGPLWISLDFDSNDTKSVAVTTVNIMCDRDSPNITIRYSLINKDGTPAYPDPETGENQVFTTTIKNKHYKPGGTVSNGQYITFTRNDLAAEHSEYYFDTISYTMGNLPGNGYPYNPSAGNSPSGGGTFWGYVTTDTVPAVMPKHSIMVYRQDAEGNVGEQLLTATTTTDIDGGTKSVYGLKTATTTATVVSAGDSVTIGGTVYVPNYPYSSNNCLNNIRLGIVLPAGVTVNAASVTATYKAGNLSVDKIEQRPLENGETLCIIKFVSGQKIGYYNEYLKAISNGDTITFSIQLNTDKSMSGQPFALRERIFVAGLGQVNSASGSYKSNSTKDYYDLNENGRTDDTVGCFGEGTTTSITFEASPAELVITDSLSNKAGETGSKLNMESFADILNYNLNIACTEGGSASDFYYMIPIGKTEITADPQFVAKCQVDLELKGEVTVTTSQGTPMKVLYSTATIANYSDTLSLDWSETLPEGKTWENVTVIKVVATEDEIENGSINVISLSLGYVGAELDYEHMAGFQIKWSSRGYYHYNVGYNSSSGTRSTAGCTVTLTYTRHEPIRFTLTAAKGGEPTGEGAKSTYSFELPEFILAQQYSVKQISPYNVTLVDADYNFKNTTSTDANDHFRVKISVKKSDMDTGSDPIALEKENDIIGSLDEHSAPEFTFTIENADALTDIVTDRRVTLTLIGDNGVIVPVEITIKRELAAAEPTTSAIVAGKMYAPFVGVGEPSINVSNDSSFTAQFLTNYHPVNYTGHSIVFDSAPIKGTTITMIDYTYPDALKFYHYTVENNDTTAVSLTEFQGMGNSSDYTESTEGDLVTECLLFIVSFPETGEAIRTNSIILTKNLKTDTTKEESDKLSFTTVKKRTFALDTSVDSILSGDAFTISYTSECGVTDSRYTDRNLSLIVEPVSGESFPIDSRLVVDGTSYYLNAQGSFIIPLKAVQIGNGEVTASFYSESTETVSMQISLWASATANGSKSLMGNEVAGPISVSVKANISPSFKVTGMSNRLLEVENVSDTITVSFDTKNTKIVTVKLQKKVGADYVTQTTILEAVNGNTIADAGQGEFTVTDTSAVLKLSGSTPVGTYRLLFTVSSENEVIEVPYNFLVIE